MGLCAFVKSKILSGCAYCLDDINQPEDEVLYGTAGYLQPLLLIKKAMIASAQPVIAIEPDAEPTWTDFKSRIDSIIQRVTIKLATQTTVTQEING